MSTAAISALNYFAPDYFAARARFCELAGAQDAVLAQYPIAARGPQGATLSIDTAYLGSETPKNLLICSSGIHGVEGFAGNALQQRWLATLKPKILESDIGVLFIHALNPYGFAYLRRVNENNVDLNRNALASFPGPANHEYVLLNNWLNPTEPTGRGYVFLANGLGFIYRYGMTTLRQSIAGGQYKFPRGLFYGGTTKQESLRLLEVILDDPRFDTVQTVLHIDLHTGLGRDRQYKFLIDADEDAPELKQFQQWFGVQMVASDHTSRCDRSIAYRVQGDITNIVRRSFTRATVYAATLEFGTYSSMRVLRMLHVENRLHNYGRPESKAGKRIKVELLKTFCPLSTRWRHALIASGDRILAQALHALAVKSHEPRG